MTREDIISQIRSKGSFLCVGLDTDPAKLPEHLRNDGQGVVKFNRAIIDATAPYTVAYKPNTAFYECRGAKGWIDLKETVDYIRSNYPEILIIADAKRGDIGNTSRMYATALFDDLGADAVTVAPYMGSDSVSPFLGHSGKWVVLLALTSNPGSHDFQLMPDAGGTPLFARVIENSKEWASEEEMMYVVGATQGKLFEEIRKHAPRHFLLVPGVGAQGGSLEDVASYGMVEEECGLLVNSSRGIIFASQGTDFAERAAAEAKALRDRMEPLLREHGVI